MRQIMHPDFISCAKEAADDTDMYVEAMMKTK